ncbi:MAG TPA: FAD-dependent oxidoreductase, partial [Thermomicrobiales bacterium]|nr:FAD-dependent oxidoreductase [Thermomicrobiales bacterium]
MIVQVNARHDPDTSVDRWRAGRKQKRRRMRTEKRGMVAVEQFDVAIIGAGQAGGPLGSAFGNAGRKTIVIERIHVGGTCVNEGCTPTKTMIASGDIAYRARRGADFGVGTGEITISMEKIRDRKRTNVRIWREGSENGLTSTPNVELLMGEASFTGPKTLRVAANDGTVREIAAGTIVINAGERPAPPRVEGAEHVSYLTSTTIMELDVVPEHLVVIGGGYVGLEFAQLFRRLGSDVTVVQHGNQLLSREDPDVAEALHDILVDDGLTIYLNAQTTHVSGADGAIELTIAVGGETVDIRGSHLLAAAGRIPNSDSLALDAAGIETDARGYIVTDDRLETNVPGVYAVGDIRPGPKFTHISYDDYRILQANLIDGGERSILDRQEPYTVFTEPQLGRIGLSEEDAKRQG